MSVQNTTSSQFSVQAKVTYVAGESKPEANFHFFSYRITIQNKSPIPAQLMSRHWIITDGLGQIEEVRGAGVTGQQPKILPGQSFEYESACPLPTSFGTMKGTYQMLSDDGTQFDVEIPEFYLVSPQALH